MGLWQFFMQKNGNVDLVNILNTVVATIKEVHVKSIQNGKILITMIKGVKIGLRHAIGIQAMDTVLTKT